MKQFHVGVAAEAFAAGLLSQCDCDVLVQYGANQPVYDLVATKDGQSMKVSVKGSQLGEWGLTQGHFKGALKNKDFDYADAIAEWADKHPGIVLCFVTFKGVALGQCPRVYLATVKEVAGALNTARNGNGDSVLRENHTYVRGIAAGTTDKIPDHWRFSVARVDSLLKRNG